MKRVLVNKILVFILTAFLFSGCKDFWHPEGPEESASNGESKVIAPALRGKWEVQYLSINGATIYLPYIDYYDSSNSIYYAGYEYTASQYSYYLNGNRIEYSGGVYSKGERIYLNTGQSFPTTWEPAGNQLVVTYIATNDIGTHNTIVCQKTNRFSWELE